MGFSRQEYWTGVPFPSPGDLPDPGIERVSPALAGGFFTTEPPGKPFGGYGCLLKTVLMARCTLWSRPPQSMLAAYTDGSSSALALLPLESE